MQHLRSDTQKFADFGCQGTAGARLESQRATRCHGSSRLTDLIGMNHNLDLVRSMVRKDHGLCSVSVIRPDGTPHSSLVNAGVLEHPFTGEAVVGFVTNGRVKLRALRANPAASALWRSDWSWVCVDGRCDVIGPDDPTDGVDAEILRLLLRNIFVAAGGTHDDWDAYDATMQAERRAAVLMQPTRIYGVG